MAAASYPNFDSCIKRIFSNDITFVIPPDVERNLTIYATSSYDDIGENPHQMP